MSRSSKFSAMLDGLLAAAGLFAFYLLSMRVFTGSWQAGFVQFRQLQWYMLALIGSFGLNVGIMQLLKCRHAQMGSTKASTASSTAAMVLCCAHHVTDLVPIIGLSGAAVFLSTYQKAFLVVGVVSNVAFMLYNLKKSKIPA